MATSSLGSVGDHAMAIRLRRARVEAGWPRWRAALALGVSEERLRRWEGGALRVRASVLVKAARAYGAKPMAMLPSDSDVRLAEAVAALDATDGALD